MPHDPTLADDARAWLSRADNDLRGAQIDLEAQPPLIEDALFHCQQVVEKSLKALLTAADIPFRKTHDLVALGALCVEAAADLDELLKRAAPLTEYAWKFRYPGDYIEPEVTEGRDALELASEVREAIQQRLNAIDGLF